MVWVWLAVALAAAYGLYQWSRRGRSVPLGQPREDNQSKMANEINPLPPRDERQLWPDRTGDRTRVELGGRPKQEDGVEGQERGPAPPTAH